MSIKADKKYNFEIIGGEWIESNNGTLGFQIFLECEDGNADFTIWLTDNNREVAQRLFNKALGVSLDQLKDQFFMQHQLPSFVKGKIISGGTEEQEWKGKKKVRVKWINTKSQSTDGNLAGAASFFFGGAPPQAENQDEGRQPGDEDDVPF